MEHCTPHQAHRVADQVREAVADFRFVWEKRVFRIGASIGLVPINDTSESISDVMSAADSACYAAKDQGRNRVHVFRLDDTDLARRQGEMRWVARINQALEDARFQLWAQPIMPVVNPDGYAVLRLVQVLLWTGVEIQVATAPLELETGVPFVEIVKLAQHIKADLIVISTHGRTGLKHALIGSTAERVVRTASCPVLSIRPPELSKD